jgi:Tol biopolymer transport system component/DNA-binding winged helix-turn-helix (wHTH) protein
MRDTLGEPTGGRWTSQPDDLRIGEIRVQPSLLQVAVRGRVHRLEPKTMRVLLRLARTPGQAVTREELFADVWPNVHVTEDVLNRAIYRLRRIVEDDPRSPRYIETIPTVGYRLLAPVETAEKDADHDAPSDPDDKTSRRRSETSPSADRPEAPSGAGLARGWRGRALVASVALGAALGISGENLMCYLVPAEGAEPSDRSDVAVAPRPSSGEIRVVPLFPAAGHQIQPALSPDGERIAYSALSENGTWDLFVGLVTENATVRRTESPASDMAPAWSSDGAQLAWIRYSANGCSIHRGPYLGREEHKLADCPAATRPRLAWSPDGRTLVYAGAAGAEATPRLWKLDLASGRAAPLTEPPSGFVGDYHPAFSRDGAWVGFVRGTVLGASDVHLLPAAGGEVRRLTHDSLVVSGLDFSPDGGHLVFSSNRSGDFGLWKVPLANGEPKWLGYSAPVLEELSVAARRPRIALVSISGHTELWETRLADSGGEPDGSDDRLLIPSSRHDRGGQYSPDGRSLAWVSSRSGDAEIWIADAEGGKPTRRSRFEGPYLGTPRWSPDGRSLLFEAQSSTNADLFRLDVHGDGPRPITHGRFHEIAPRWSADGRSVLFASDRSGAWQVWRMTIEDRASKQVTENGGFAAVESPDGRRLYYTKAQKPGLWIAPTDGHGEERRLVDDLEPSDWRTVVPVEGGVLYARRSSGLQAEQAELVRLDPETGRVETLRRALELPFSSDLDVSPDGRTLLHSRWHQMDADLYLLDNLL